MDALIGPRASAMSLAIAAVLLLVPALVGPVNASEVADPGAPTPARKAMAPATGAAAKVRPRPRPVDRSAVGPRADRAAAPPLALGPRKPLALSLTQSEMGSILFRYQPEPSDAGHSAFDDVTVMAPAELQPMRDPAHEIWGGIAAPVWALLHPTEAWRIFLPVPPK